MRHTLIACTAVWLLCSLPAHAAAVTCTNENTSIPASTPTAQFTLHDDGTATDTATGLMWMRCSLGQTWNDTACDEATNANLYNWQEALQVTQDINSGTSNDDNDNATGFAGHTDWRLPNKNELESIVERRCWSPAINAGVFPNTPGSLFWSSSPDANNDIEAWEVYFDFGTVVRTNRPFSSRQVRLVRAGQ